MRRSLAGTTLLLLLLAPAWAQAPERKPTRVVVRVAANDGKLLDDKVGGARVRIADARTGKVLAEGVQQGNSGDTDKIMKQPHARGAALFDTPGAAIFTAELALDGPTLVRISGTGPLKYPESVRTTEKTLTLMPGEDVTGDGIVLQVDGLIVDVNQATPSEGKLEVEAHVAMMCGCPISPGGLWDAARFKIVAEAWRGRERVAMAPMSYAGKASTFRATFEGLRRGKYELRISAVSDNGANAGQARRKVRVP